MKRNAVLIGMLGLTLWGCGGTATAPGRDPATPSAPTSVPAATAQPTATNNAQQRFPDIVGATLTRGNDGSYDIAVTVSSPYDTPQRYADGWRVLAPDGSMLGEHTLLHDHASEQPFTRTQSGVRIPDDVQQVIIEGRDQQYGYGGKALEVVVPR